MPNKPWDIKAEKIRPLAEKLFIAAYCGAEELPIGVEDAKKAMRHEAAAAFLAAEAFEIAVEVLEEYGMAPFYTDIAGDLLHKKSW